MTTEKQRHDAVPRPFIASWFNDRGHEGWLCWYVTPPIFLPAPAYAFMGDTKHASRIGRGTPDWRR
jgi:hypothetical protein